MKNTSLIIGIFSLAIVTILFYSRTVGFCGELDVSCAQSLQHIASNLIVFVPFFAFSIITYFLRKEVQKAWFKFSLIWVPLTIIAQLLFVKDSGNFVAQGYYTMMFLGLLLLYIILSIVVIVWKNIKQ